VFRYARPTTLADAFSLLSDEPAARILNGGTDLIVALRKGTVRPPLVIDVKRIEELRPGIESRDGMLRIGATTVLTQVIADQRVRTIFPALVEAAEVVGSIQIRNRATLAGNMCNASPAADTAPPLLAYGATLELVSRSGMRIVPLSEFFLGPRSTVLGPGELVDRVVLPLPDRPVGSAFARMTRRRGVDLATVSLCCSVAADGATRFAFGAVGPRPFVVDDETALLADSRRSEADVHDALSRLAAHASPISDVRGSAEYRRAMLLVLGRRALDRAHARLAANRDGS
jgi:CO/xanthine dehydrogenase FAD-binding subunit